MTGPADPRTALFHALVEWLRGLGSCVSCAIGLAVWGVEHGPAESPTFIGCTAPGHRRGQCVQRVRCQWPYRPKLSEPQGKAA